MIELLIFIKNLLLILLLFGASIFVHELGHFLVAKKLGFKINTFSIGFGKAIVSRVIDGVEWKIAWIPLGGYVALPQMDPSSGNRIEGTAAADTDSPWIHPWKKICVAVAGAFMNVVFAFLLAIIVWQAGVMVGGEKLNAQVGYVEAGSPADQAGMEVGDLITRTRIPGEKKWKKIPHFHDFIIEAALKKEIEVEWKGEDGTERALFTTVKTPIGNMLPFIGGYAISEVGGFSDLSPARDAGVLVGDLITHLNDLPILHPGQFADVLQQVGDQPITLTLDREGKEAKVTLNARMATEDELAKDYGPYMIGIEWGSFSVEMHPTPFQQLHESAFAVFRVLEALTTPKEMSSAAGSLSGPVGIVDALLRMFNISFMQALSFIVLININLAILNLLPIPILDGGHVMFSLYEWIRGRPIPQKLVVAHTNLFLVVFLLVFILISINDVRRTYHLNKMTKAAEEVPAADPDAGDAVPATP